MAPTKARRYRFKGWGWEELAECWGMTLSEPTLEAYFPTPELMARLEALLKLRPVQGSENYALPSREEQLQADPEAVALLDQYSAECERVELANQEAVRDRLHEAMSSSFSPLFKQTVKDVRRFVRAIVRQSFDKKGKPLMGCSPVWKALLKCDNWSMLQLTDTLLPHMWT